MSSRALVATVATVWLAVASAGPTIAQPVTTKRSAVVSGDPAQLDRGREVTKKFYDGKLDELHAQFRSEMKKEVTLEDLRTMHGRVSEQLGNEIEIVSESAKAKTMPDGDYVVYVRRVRFNRQIQTDYELHWAWSSDGKIAGFFVRKSDR